MYTQKRSYKEGVSGIFVMMKSMTKEEYAAFTRCSNTMLDLIMKYSAEVKDAETQKTRK
jgi:hypothetical protein